MEIERGSLSGSFLDTTVLVDIAERGEPYRTKCEAFIRANQPAATPFYALRELLAGHVRNLCTAHNILLAAETAPEAMLALLRISPAEGRKKQDKLQALASAMQEAFSSNPSGDRQDMKREMLQNLAVQVNRLWRGVRRLKAVSIVHSLSCFNDGRITYGSAGELRGPRDSFNCIKTERCAAAAYIYDNQSDLAKMICALHPHNLDSKAAKKGENVQRRKALKELQSKGPAKFDKSRCRALGDAYFVSMCPPGSVVVTSNLEDHVPLCRAVGKEAKAP